jgi:hypothetical protein
MNPEYPTVGDVWTSGLRPVASTVAARPSRGNPPGRTAAWTVLFDGRKPASFDIDWYRERFPQHRGRPIVRVPTPAASPARAAWTRGLGIDCIPHSAGTSPLHRDLLGLHGIGRVLLEHLGNPAIADPAVL